MKVLFVSISPMPDLDQHSISLDLIREFRRNGHEMYVVCALEKRTNQETYLRDEAGCRVLRVRIGNNKKANVVEKGLTALSLPKKYIAAIKTYFSDVRFDLILYPTPPVTHVKTVEYVKKRDGAKAYLLLKDIFPQNAVDIGMLATTGAKGILYRYFRRQEKRLYAVSDHIGCMSPANAAYLLSHNPELDPAKVGVCPNAIEVRDRSIDRETRVSVRQAYGIPLDRRVFVYGGNLGKPQGIPFLIACIQKAAAIENAYFVIVGDGTEYGKLDAFVRGERPKNVRLIRRLSKDDYDSLAAACDVGLIFLDHRFTIPNFPSRLLGYMQAKLPVLACTDPHTDIGSVIVEGGFGWWCESNDADGFCHAVEQALAENGADRGQKSFDYLCSHYTASSDYREICRAAGIG